MLPVLLLYLALVNAATYAAYALDKSQAIAGGRRISENTLLGLGLFGGSPAAFAAQRMLRHKTRKMPFQALFWLTVVLQIVAIGAAWSWVAHHGPL